VIVNVIFGVDDMAQILGWKSQSELLPTADGMGRDNWPMPATTNVLIVKGSQAIIPTIKVITKTMNC